MTTTIRKQFLIGATALGLTFGALSVHASPPEGPGNRGEQRAERMKERMEKRSEDLRAKLNLNAEQQKAWEAYIAAMKPAQQQPQRPSREEMAKLTAPERMERTLQMMQHAEQQMAKRVAATRDFYAVLTPEQRKVFDENFSMAQGPDRKAPQEKGHKGKGHNGEGRGGEGRGSK